jgi:hypothetical protein
VEEPLDVHRLDATPICECDLGKRLKWIDARVVDDDVGAAELLHRVMEFDETRLRRDIAGDGDALAPGLRDQLQCLSCVLDVRNDDPDPILRQPTREFLTNPVSGTGDDCSSRVPA